MIKYLRLFRDLELFTGNGSQKAKQDLIRINIDPAFEYMLNVCFNPFITTKLNKIAFNDTIAENNDNLLAEFYELVDELKNAPAANDSLRRRANAMISARISDDVKEDLELRTILMKILTKRMNIGIGAKLINKALGKELIPDPSVMLATDDQSLIEKWNKVYCEEKYDGVRVIALYKAGEISFFTRAFNDLDVTCLSRIAFALKSAMINSGLPGDWFFDGELTDLNRKSVSGKVTQILKGTASKNIDDSMLFNVFDFDEAGTLENGIGIMDYITRRETLEKVMKYASSDSPVVLAQMWELEDASGVAEIYQRIVDLGGEGVICKNNHLYECKRSKSWIKFKEVNECDLVVTGWYPGEGKREGLIGGFTCTDKSGTLNVKVGSGFTDSDLNILSKDPDSHIGSIISVLYNVTIEDKHGNRSLFLPRFVDKRADKSEADDMSSKF
jgi:DNA ligase-1